MRLVLALPLVVALAGCTDARQQCLAEATHDLRVIDGLIAETELAISRGYGERVETVSYPYYGYCGGYGHGYHGHLSISLCHDFYPRSRVVPVAIDIAEERRKLASLRGKRPEVVARTKEAVRQCNAAHAG